MSITITKNKIRLLKFHFLFSAHTFLWRTGCWVSSLKGPKLLGWGSVIKSSGWRFTVWKLLCAPKQREFAQPCMLTKYLLMSFSLSTLPFMFFLYYSLELCKKSEIKQCKWTSGRHFYITHSLFLSSLFPAPTLSNLFYNRPSSLSLFSHPISLTM